MNLKLEDFLYELPKNRIAQHPSGERSKSKLLFYNQGTITHHQFDEIPSLLPRDSLIAFNNTKVIPARISMRKATGALIEICLLEPMVPPLHEAAMNSRKTAIWKCLIGNSKKWKIGTSLLHESLGIRAIKIDENTVRFDWDHPLTFSDLLEKIGKIPLPPYLGRDIKAEDEQRYQTVYSQTSGAIAAPTAGLHFTANVIEEIQNRGIETEYLTLHVSAGTFLPIKDKDVTKHPMHNEQLWVTEGNVKKLLNTKKTIAVGTTSMRSMESLYWFGVKLINGEKEFYIRKEDPYKLSPCSKIQALEAVLNHMHQNQLTRLGGNTEIYIYPGYQCKICDGLVTNYHLPGSTLILLVAALIGEDWRKVYKEALTSDYQFLSYGDSSLLIPK